MNEQTRDVKSTGQSRSMTFPVVNSVAGGKSLNFLDLLSYPQIQEIIKPTTIFCGLNETFGTVLDADG